MPNNYLINNKYGVPNFQSVLYIFKSTCYKIIKIN